MQTDDVKPLQITILTYGSRGDVEPFLALGEGLVSAGHRATLAAPERYQSLNENPRLRYHGLPGDPGSLADALREQAGGNPLKIFQAMSRHVLPIAADVFHEIQKATQGADIILHSFTMVDGGHSLARRAGAVDMSAQLFPVLQPTGQFPGMTFPDLPWGDLYRRLTHHINTFVFRWGGRLMYRYLRWKHPQLPRLVEWPFSRRAPQPVPQLFAFSEEVVPRPPEWPEHVIITGYWSRKRGHRWKPSPALKKFLKENPEPVFIGLGSMVPDPEEQIVHLFLKALKRVNQPGLTSVAEPKHHSHLGNKDVFFTGPLPHDWILPRSSAVVHHGGAGTTGAVIQAGVPGVVLPVSADQFFWGRRVKKLGAGPEPIAFQKLTLDKLHTAFKEALEDPALKTRARRLGNQVQAEDGVGRAIEEIERFYKERRSEEALARKHG